MSKVKYDNCEKTYKRIILINGVRTGVCSKNKEELEKMPYRLNSKFNGEQK